MVLRQALNLSERLPPLPEGFRLLAYEDFDRDLLYRVLALRSLVFVVEQKSPFLDVDGRDQEALHLVYRDGLAYMRLFIGPDPSRFGRVVVASEARGQGLGRLLVQTGLDVLDALAPGVDVAIGAQTYLERWYAAFGFELTGVPYDDDGVMHVAMVRKARARR